MNKKILTPLVLSIIVIVAIVAAAVILVKKESSKNKTADWKTYINEKYGYEIKYPEDAFKLSESSCTIPVSNKQDIKDENVLTLSHEVSLKLEKKIDLQVKVCNVSGNYKELANYYSSSEPVKIGPYDAYLAEAAYVSETIGENAFFKYYYINVDDNKTMVIFFSGLNFYRSNIPGNNMLEGAFSEPQKTKMINDILSTFKLTPPK